MGEAVGSGDSPAENYDDSGEREAIIQSLYRGLISSELAAERLAFESLSGHDTEGGLLHTWKVIIANVMTATEDHLGILSTQLSNIARLPPAKDDQGQQLKMYNLRIWDDLPMFDWEFYDAFAQLGSPGGEEDIKEFLHVNKFAAQLMRTHAIFADYDFWTIVVMREALEYPEYNPEIHFPAALIPAAVTWISMLGSEIYTWNKEFPYGGKLGDRGGGGPLWDGKHGFCKERWALWKQRFVDLSSSDEMDDALKRLCNEGAAKMAEVES